MADAVNSPKHYTSHPSGVECITIAEHMTFNAGNVLKYIWRAGLKDGPDGEEAKLLEDLRKAQWYLAREIARKEAELGGAKIPEAPPADAWEEEAPETSPDPGWTSLEVKVDGVLFTEVENISWSEPDPRRSTPWPRGAEAMFVECSSHRTCDSCLNTPPPSPLSEP